MGITALWVGPIFKQVAWLETYHGYGVQDFLNIDPRFSTREDLKALVEEAHENGMYVILDTILNHSGDVFEYEAEKPIFTGETHAVKGFYAAQDDSSLAFGSVTDAHHPDGAIWPSELQSPECFTRKGRFVRREHTANWEREADYLHGDFYDFKNFVLGDKYPDNFVAPRALKVLCEAHKFWIAYANIDGYRVDTVKHM